MTQSSFEVQEPKGVKIVLSGIYCNKYMSAFAKSKAHTVQTHLHVFLAAPQLFFVLFSHILYMGIF